MTISAAQSRIGPANTRNLLQSLLRFLLYYANATCIVIVVIHLDIIDHLHGVGVLLNPSLRRKLTLSLLKLLLQQVARRSVILTDVASARNSLLPLITIRSTSLGSYQVGLYGILSSFFTDRGRLGMIAISGGFHQSFDRFLNLGLACLLGLS